MLYGFTISNFRNFDEREQWLSPLGRVNIFIGTNNSGKSNVLRYIKKVLAPALLSSRSKAVKVGEVDRPRRGGQINSVSIWAPFDKSNLVSGRDWHPHWTDAFRKLDLLDPAEHFIKLTISTGPVQAGNRFYGSPPQADHPTKQAISSLWNALTGSTGGTYERNWFFDTMNQFIQKSLIEINPHYVPSFRHIPTRMSDYVDEYAEAGSAQHIIERLAELAYPSYTEQGKKADFEKLRQFVGEIIDDPKVSIEIPNDRSTVNVRTGEDFLPIEALGSGIHEVFILAAEIILNQNQTFLLEEPEVHLHPHLQRRLMRFIMEETSNQFYITTHSSTVIDTPGAQVFGVRSEGVAHIHPLVTSQERFIACRELGFKASDLLQTNCIIWVEGPSDRIYVQGWLREAAPELSEGIHFSLMFYGGKLLSHLSVQDRELQDFIAILPLSRQVAMILDSDLSGAHQQLRDSKLRVILEIENVSGLAWVTAGREIENYYARPDREEAVKSVHPKAVRVVGNRTRYEKPLAFERGDGSKVETGFDKVSIAKALIEARGSPHGQLDFDHQIGKLVAFIRRANE